MRAFRPSLVALLAVLVATGWLGGCGDDGDATGTTTTAEVATTAGDTTSTPPTEVPGTTAAPTTAPVDLGDAPPFHDDRASGSGCTPGTGPLPDGWWYTTPPLTFDAVAGAYTFDLACYYVGAAAEAEAARRGDEVNNDYYVVNDNPTLRTLPLAAGATASCVELGAGVLEVECAPADIPDPVTPWAVWLRVVDGEIDRLVEQYAP